VVSDFDSFGERFLDWSSDNSYVPLPPTSGALRALTPTGLVGYNVFRSSDLSLELYHGFPIARWMQKDLSMEEFIDRSWLTIKYSFGSSRKDGSLVEINRYFRKISDPEEVKSALRDTNSLLEDLHSFVEEDRPFPNGIILPNKQKSHGYVLDLFSRIISSSNAVSS
jgi:hypothetical protein